ncbi:hypothetical protein B296_00039241, partial [Ensete ventricosum]
MAKSIVDGRVKKKKKKKKRRKMKKYMVVVLACVLPARPHCPRAVAALVAMGSPVRCRHLGSPRATIVLALGERSRR